MDLSQLSDKGRIFAYPFYGMSRMMTYRKSWLNQKGIDVPDTWEEFTKAAEILTEPPNQYGFVMKLNKFDNGLTYVLYALVYNLGGSFWDEDLNPTLDTPEESGGQISY